MLRAFHRLQETVGGYSLTQLVGFPTLSRYRTFVCRHIPPQPGRRVLEIGCGLGWARHLFVGDYTGIDINPDYIDKARKTLTGHFYVMDAAQMPFERDSFDDAVSIATTHHLSDEQLSSMIRKAAEVARRLHIVDAILPISPRSRFKDMLFRMDRGRFPRSIDELRHVVRSIARIEFDEVTEGPLHDVCYIRAARH